MSNVASCLSTSFKKLDFKANDLVLSRDFGATSLEQL